MIRLGRCKKANPAKVETKDGEENEGEEIVEVDVKARNGKTEKEARKAEEMAQKTSADERRTRRWRRWRKRLVKRR